MHTVIYHNNCYDGVCAAWVMHKYFVEKGIIPGGTYKTVDFSGQSLGSGKPAEAFQFKACNYSDEPPWDLIDGANVYVVDFSWLLDKMQEIVKRAKWVIVLDHHKTAEAALKELSADNLDIMFDMDRSGAGLAWDYFMANDSRPPLVDFVEDRDLWRYKLPHSREINAYIQSFEINLQVWIDEFGNGSIYHQANMEIGNALLRQQSKLVKQIAANAKLTMLPDIWKDGRLLPTGIYTQTSILMSEVCEQMLVDYPEAQFVFYSFVRKDGKQQYGLRSRVGSSIDVSDIAKMYGGGGHKHAAGFEL